MKISARTRRPGVLHVLLAAGVAAPGAVAACADGGTPGWGNGASTSDGGNGSPGDGAAATLAGAQIYATQCASCHGAKGEGGDAGAPSLQHESIAQSALAALIVNAGMPLDAPNKCTGACASDVAAYILSAFGGTTAACTSATPPAVRGLRLLSRREYAATVADLLNPSRSSSADDGGATATDAGSVCAPPSFSYAAQGQTLPSGVVSGTFNDWAMTAAAGAWPLTSNGGTWTGTAPVSLPAGTYQYKFVLDGSTWVTDPSNPSQTSDAQGGFNSVLTAVCGAGAVGGSASEDAGAPATSSPDPTAGFPPEAEPAGFLFDDQGPSRYVQPAMMSAYWSAASALASATNLRSLVSCDYVANAAPCAQTFVTTFGMRAFRRPLVPAEIGRYTSLLTTGVGDAGDANGFLAGVALVVRAMLLSPSFLYRPELGVAQSDGTFLLSPYETASALSYMVWGTMPDQTLFDAAANGKLSAAADIETQVRRLLADPRARTLIGSFASQWLGVANLATMSTKAPPWDALFTADVRQAMLAETEQLVSYVMFDGTRTFDELMTANYSFMNGPLASVYGIAGVSGEAMRKVAYPDTRRAGILGHGSILATNAYSDQTSPILRGLFIRQNILCQTMPPPPANVPPLPPVNPDASTRERITEHAANAFCQTCHADLDPPGFGFESFDPIGAWQTDDNGPIDSSGDMNDLEKLNAGTHAPFTSMPELGAIVAASQAAPACFVNQYYSFAHGYTPLTDCSVSGLVSHFESTGHDMQELVVNVATASDFLVRQ